MISEMADMKCRYIAPQVEIIEVEVEAGFAQSIERPSGGGNHDWAVPFAGVEFGRK